VNVPGLAALALGLGVLGLLARRHPRTPWLIGLAGFAMLLLATWTLDRGEPTPFGGEVFVATAYIRLFLVLLTVASGVLTVVAWAASLTPALPGAMLTWFGAASLGLSVSDPVPAIVVLTAGAMVPTLAGLPFGTDHAAGELRRVVRALAVSALIACLATAVAGLVGVLAEAPVPGGAGSLGADGDGLRAGGLGLAFLGAATALGLRAGAVPVHRWVGRLTDSLTAPALPVILAWGPAAFAIVLLGWSKDALGPGANTDALLVERLLVGAVGLASMVLGAAAAFLHDDLAHVVAYSLVSDAGVLLLAFASLDTAALAPARTWILVYVVVRTAFAGWAAAVMLAYGTRRVPALRGWARRSPLLAAGLVVVAVATVGLPGMAVFDARLRVIDLALPDPFNLLAWVGIVVSVGYFGRLLANGVRRPSAEVQQAVGVQPVWPGGRPSRDLGVLRGQLSTAIRLNFGPAAALAVLALAILGLAVAAGAFEGPAFAAEPRV
jgi:NADH:ubiquinone oxidoreductase subunit 2 (subunit N)